MVDPHEIRVRKFHHLLIDLVLGADADASLAPTLARCPYIDGASRTGLELYPDLVTVPPWFRNLNGAFPLHYARREHVDEASHHLLTSLAEDGFGGAMAIVGARGSGKTVELGRIKDVALERGVLPIDVTLRAERMGSPMSQLMTALGRQLGIRASRRDTKIGASGKIPFTGVEVSLESSGGAQVATLNDLLDQAVATRLALGGVLFIIDEGDFFTNASLEDALADVLGESSRSGRPVSACIAGSGYGFLDAIRGESTFVQSLFNTVPLMRLNVADSVNLLLQTGQQLGQDWTELTLEPVVTASKGIPRYLQSAAGQLFDSFARNPGAIDVPGIAAGIDGRLAVLDSHLGASTRKLIRAMDDLFGESSTLHSQDFFDRFYELGFTDDDRKNGPLDWLFASGRIEFDEAFNFRRA